MWSNSKPKFDLLFVSTNDEMIQSNVVPPISEIVLIAEILSNIKVPMVILAVDYVITKLKSLQRHDQAPVMQLVSMHWMVMDNFSFVFKIWQWIVLQID